MSPSNGIQTSARAEELEDRLADFTRDRRMVVLSAMALVVGAMSAANRPASNPAFDPVLGHRN